MAREVSFCPSLVSCWSVWDVPGVWGIAELRIDTDLALARPFTPHAVPVQPLPWPRLGGEQAAPH